jgi:hypothetical protein
MKNKIMKMNFDNLNKKGDKEKKEEFNFKEILEIKNSLTDIVFQIKNKIETNYYNNLISDEVGGRIPTIVLKKIINTIKPEHNFNTLFLSVSGEKDFNEIKDLLVNNLDLNGNTLISTEYIRTGSMITKMCEILRKCNIKNIDLCTLCVSDDFSSKDREEFLHKNCIQSFYTQDDDVHLSFSEKHNQFSEMLQSEIKLSNQSLNLENDLKPENQELKNKIIKDIDLLTKEIVKMVWNK